MVRITEGLEIPDHELDFIVSRSGGPGGQNVNKVSSRVTLRFDVDRSAVLSTEQRKWIHAKLATRINKDGILQVTSQRTRSQDLNREDVLSRFAELLRNALHQEKSRIKTNATRASREERLQEKKKRTQLKQGRSVKGSRAWDE